MKNFLNRIIDCSDYFILFALDAVLMILELVAARLMSPYFGNSNFVWTAIIGIILLAGSLGNLIGGRIASRKHPRYIACLLLLAASIYIATIPLVEGSILGSTKELKTGVQFEAVISSILLFLCPSTILGTIPPIVMKERISESKNKGKESGRITAVIALGSLVGTFLGGFWLIPTFGTKIIFAMLAICIALIAPLFILSDRDGLKRGIIVSMLFALVTLIFGIISLIIVNDGAHNSEISIDTEYGRIIIVEENHNGENIRYYKQSGAYSSATYTSDQRKYDLVFDYLKKYDEMFKFRDVDEVVMIGGAAYQYPKYYISHFLDKKMDVIEIDPKSTEIAKQYFYLNDLLYDYGDERLGLYNDDGRIFLRDSKKKYDAVLNDAFSGEVPVGTMATVEAAKIIKNSLKDDGVYMSNVLGAVEGDKGKFLRAEVKTLQQVFKHVYVIAVYKNPKPERYVNWMVVATDNDKYTPNDIVDVRLTDDDIILTDDYNPVDSLVTTNYFE